MPWPTITPALVAELLVEGELMPVHLHVIEHPDARVLVDTGMTDLHPAVADMDPRLVPLSEQADFNLSGIDIEISTHLHFDQCGRNHLFTGKPIYVQRRELNDARSQDDHTTREWVEAPGAQTVPVDGELELLRGLRLVPAPGHTPGSQGARRRDERASGRHQRRHGGLLRRARRAAQRRPAAGVRARPRAGLAHAHPRAMAAALLMSMPSPSASGTSWRGAGRWFQSAPWAVWTSSRSNSFLECKSPAVSRSRY
jgi:hypothetical protein